jgi:glycosyltransferase involved in cell wall biosynthesis
MARLVVATLAKGSGMGRFSVELANAIEQAGAEVLFIAPEQEHRLAVSQVERTIWPTRKRGLLQKIILASVSLDLARRIVRPCGGDAPMLMIAIAPTLPISLVPIIVAKLTRAKIALSLHDFYPHSYRFPKRFAGLERALYRWAYRRFDAIMTNNEQQTRRLVAEAGVPASCIATLYHGVFTVPDIEPAAANDETNLLIFGSLRPNKQVLESIKAVVALRARGVKVRLHIAGAPRREDAAYWQSCLAVLPADDAAFHVEARFIDEAELPRILSGVHAFLCPYSAFDSQSGVSMMAVSNGVPMIATLAARPPSLRETDESWVQVAPEGDVPAISTAIEAFIAMPFTQRLAAAETARGRLQDEAGWPRLARLYLEAMQARGFWKK